MQRKNRHGDPRIWIHEKHDLVLIGLTDVPDAVQHYITPAWLTTLTKALVDALCILVVIFYISRDIDGRAAD